MCVCVLFFLLKFQYKNGYKFNLSGFRDSLHESYDENPIEAFQCSFQFYNICYRSMNNA